MACNGQGLMEEERKKEVERDLEAAVRKGKAYGMSGSELTELFHLILEDQEV